MYNVPQLIASDGFLDALDASLSGGAPAPVLRDAKIKLTSRCNLRCVMCRYWQTEHEQALASERWRGVFAELAELGCRKVHFSGGEVFLRPDFLDLADAAIGLGLKVNMTTNGTLVTREASRRIASMGVNSVSISLDGPTASVHDAIRGQPRAFARSVATIRRLKRLAPRLKVRVNVVVMRDNFRRLPAMVELAGALGADELLPMPVDERGPRKRRLSARQILEYNREIAPRVQALRRRYGLSTSPALVYPFGVTEAEVTMSAAGLYARGFFDRRPCLVPWLHAFFAWDGETYLCCMTNGRMESLGNVGRAPVRDIFHGERYARVREAFMAGRQLPSCQRCDLFLPENAALQAALEQRRHVSGAVAGRRDAASAGVRGLASGVEPGGARQ
jgi:MoaA/NifB/PqqE/SkfB family radical SAM enzyme